jgi:uncharacterized repeat protein (TIGR02543 family)
MPSITIPTRTGYAFGGYYTAANGGGTQYYTASGTSARSWDKTAATTLFAKWMANAYTISFDANGGTLSSSAQTAAATYGSALPDCIPTPTRNGYVFAGWSADQAGTSMWYGPGGAKLLSSYATPKDTALYAIWLPEKPAIAPHSGTVITGSVTVVISCAAEGAAIHYTTDGSEPTAESPLNRRFRVSQRTIVKAVAIKDGFRSDVAVAEYACGQCADPVITPEDGTSFEHSGQSVSITWSGDDGVLRYTTDGSDPTAVSPVYGWPFAIDETTVVKAKVFGDQFFDSNVVTANLTRVWLKVATPSIAAAATFTGSKTSVALSCATPGAMIYYTTNGGTPNSHSTRYSEPFSVTDSCTVKAYATCADYSDSAVATFAITKVWGIGDTMGDADQTFTTGGDAPFFRVDDATAPLGESMKSGAITHNQTSAMSAMVDGPGTVSFLWKTSCEDSSGVYDWDHAEFEVDGTVVACLDGETGWQTVSQKISSEGSHSLVWRYAKDAVGSEGEDCCWVADYQWSANTYSVILDQQGGSGGTASVTATYGAAMPAITIPTRANLKFGGYFTGTNGRGTQYYTATGASVRPWDRTSDTTLYALWRENQSPAFTSATPDTDFIAMELGATEDFSVTTSDPDGDAVTVKWYIVEEADQNRVLAGSGNGYAFTATTAGTFRVEAVASDGIADATCQWDVKVFPADVADYDEVPGSGLVWSVTGTTLTISGNGPMPDYADADPPYQTYAGTITAIVVEEGVTSVGDNAFQDFQNVASVILPETLTSIGIGAFADCGGLVTIAIPDSVETLGEGMFYGCNALEMLYLPQRFVPYVDDLGIPDICSVANTDVYHFVRRLYNLCLGREPEWSGCATWSKRLTSGERNGAMAAFGFCLSAEMERRNLSNAEYVEVLYRAMMGRAPDSNGKAYWVDLLDNGVSRRGVFRGFAESAEFTRICNDYGITRGNVDRSKLEQRDLNYGVTKFVARCYKKALNHNYDVKGLNSWCGKINSSSTKKATAIQVARSFLKSAEFQKRNLSNAAYVDVLYQTFLGHAPDSKGRKSWLDKLNSGVSRDTVMAGFYNSNEFTTIMAGYGIR